MSIIDSELALNQSATMAASFSTASVGGASTTTAITGGSIGEVFFTMGANTLGGGTKTQYAKVFFKNANASIDLTSAVVYIKNSLDAVVSNGTVSVASSSASDTSTYKITVLGYDASSAAQSEDITLNGVTTATGALTFSAVHRVEYRVVSSGLLAAATGDITITRSVTLGIIPATYKSATAEVDIGLVATLGGTTTIATAAAAPAGISFSRPNAESEGLQVASGSGSPGTLTFGNSQAVWLSWACAELSRPSADIQVVLVISGSTA